jgi:ParB-like chromosome segregation protein Spo0J
LTVSSFVVRETSIRAAKDYDRNSPQQDLSNSNDGFIDTDTERYPVTRIPVSAISDGIVLRRSGSNSQHVRTLAESDDPLPPIIVQRATMSVIDGAHRLQAARMRGQKEIDARLVDADQASCFVIAVRANVTHGLPLSLADRKAAAVSVIRYYPHWSDRMIASVSGLAARTVSGLRHLPSAGNNQLDGRIGRDGRARPMNSAERRRIATDIITEHPEASLREIAERAGISPETARKVRLQLRRDQSTAAEAPPKEAEQPTALQALRRDPALRSREHGRLLLRMLSAVDTLDEYGEQMIEHIPAHDLAWVARASRVCARTWERFADLAERRNAAAAGNGRAADTWP